MSERVQLTNTRSCQIIGAFLLVSLLSVMSIAPAATKNDQNPATRAITAMKNGMSTLSALHRHKNTGTVRIITTDLIETIDIPYAASNEERVRAFLQNNQDAFTNSPLELQVLRNSELDVSGNGFIHLKQTFQGIPVTGAEIIVHLNASGVTSILSKLQSNLHLVDTQADITAAQASEYAMLWLNNKYKDSSSTNLTQPQLDIFSEQLLLGYPGGDSVLTWKITASSNTIDELIWIDAHNGEVLKNINQTRNAFDIVISTPNPLTIVREESCGTQDSPVCHPNTDPDIEKAYESSLDAFNYFQNTLGRHGWKDNDQLDDTIGVYVKDTNTPTSSWDNNQNLMSFNLEYSQADDVVVHEYTHGVIKYTAALNNVGEAGIIAESLGDIFGETVDLTNGKGNDSDIVRWSIGEDVSGQGAFRNMKSPNKFSDPNRMTDTNYYCGGDNETSIHTNSGVINHAYFLLVDGGEFNNLNIAAIGLEKAAKVFYRTMSQHLVSNSTYFEFSKALDLSCTELSAESITTTDDCEQVKKTIAAVELLNTPCSTQVAMCPVGEQPVYKFKEDFENPSSNNWKSTVEKDPLDTDYPDQWNGGDGTAPNDVYHQKGSVGTYPNRPRNGNYSLWGKANLLSSARPSDSSVEMVNNEVLPPDARIQIEHNFIFDDYSVGQNGGRIEASFNDGPWEDIGNLITSGIGYNGILNDSGLESAFPPLLNKKNGFVYFSLEDENNNPLIDYASTQLDLSSHAGENIKMRFRVGVHRFTSAYRGWIIDDVGIYHCEPAGLIADPTTGLKTSEVGGTASFTIRLGFVPVSTISLSIKSDDSSEGVVTTLDTVSFTVFDWNVPKTVTVMGVDDPYIDENTAYNIQISDKNTAAPAFDTVNIPIINEDDENKKDPGCPLGCHIGSENPQDALVFLFLALSVLYLSRYRPVARITSGKSLN